MRDVKVGDMVTWRQAPTKNFQPLGVVGCKVLELGRVSEEGEPAAIIEALGQKVPVRVSDLHLETSP